MLKLEYRTHCCAKHKREREAIQLDGGKGFDRLLQIYTDRIFKNQQVPESYRKQLLEKYTKQLSKAIDIGYNPTSEFYDGDLVNALKTNIAEFSAFKEASFHKTLVDLLHKNNTFPTWATYKKEAKKVHDLYNVNWLKAEYHQTIATANMAEKWKEFQSTKDLYPNLKYSTAGDERVRDKHKKWDGFIAPIDHPIWRILFAPNDWGCRCNVVATDEPVSKELEEFKPNIKENFKNNAGDSGKVFANNSYAVPFSDEDKTKIIQRGLSSLHKTAPKELKRYVEREIYELPRETQFKEMYSSEKGKGKVTQHLLVDKTADDYKEVFESAKAFADEGSVAELMPEVKGSNFIKYHKKIYINYNSNSNPDLRIDEIYYDVKRPNSIKNILHNANKSATKQKAIAVIHCKLFNITKEVMRNRADDILDLTKNVNDKKEPNYIYSEVYFLHNGTLIKFNRR